MKLRGLGMAAVAALIVGVFPAGASAHATLIDVHGIKMAGKPGPATANCSPDGAVNGLYGLTGWQVGGARTARLNASTVPSALGSVTSTLQAAFNVWRANGNVPQITVATGATVTKPTANRSYDLMWGRTSGSSLAVTYTWRWNDGTIESDTIFNSRVPWAQLVDDGDGCVSQPVYDVGNIATHEFGHTYGLDHPPGDRFETMYAYGYTGETLKRSPASGDIAGINANY
jgi:hypothetical protein